ncbi:MAG: hypothetical protein IH885_01065 [Myxococcales bacterium]|nr:hypothetical protein [Myxococcales bacterium]
MSNATQNARGTMAFLALCNTTAADGPQEGRWRDVLMPKLHALSVEGTLGPMQPRTNWVRRVVR